MEHKDLDEKGISTEGLHYKQNIIKEHLDKIIEELGLSKCGITKGTSERISRMWVQELFANVNYSNMDELDEEMTTFKEDRYNEEMIVVKDIPFSSTCAHHFLPFSGKVTIGYIPNGKLIGLSKIPRVVKYFSKKPQLQEILTDDILKYLTYLLKPTSLFIQVTAEHQCVKCRGAESDCTTVTTLNYFDPVILYGMSAELQVATISEAKQQFRDMVRS